MGLVTGESAHTLPGGGSGGGDFIPLTHMGAANGVATLDEYNVLTIAQLPITPYVRNTIAAFVDAAANDVNHECENLMLTPGYRLYTVETSRPARVRLYSTVAAQTADLARPIGTDPAADAGVILDYVTTVANHEYTLSPLVDGVHLEDLNGPVPCTLTPSSGSALTAIGVTFRYLVTEETPWWFD